MEENVTVNEDEYVINDNSSMGEKDPATLAKSHILYKIGTYTRS